MAVCAIIEAAVGLASLTDETAVYALQTAGGLAHPVRRRVVAALLEDGSARREQLAELVAADEATDVDDADRAEVLLHHQHLPKLDEQLFVEYDRRNGDVVLWTDPDTAARLLDSA